MAKKIRASFSSVKKVRRRSRFRDVSSLVVDVVDNYTIITPGSEEVASPSDIIETTQTNPVVYNQPNFVVSRGGGETKFFSLNPSVINIDSDGNTKKVNSGSVFIVLKIKGVFLIFVVSSENEVLGEVTTEIEWKSNTVGGYATNSILSRIQVAESPSQSLPLFSSQNHASNVFVRNLDCWLEKEIKGVTSISPSNEYANQRRAGLALTKRHVWFAAHYPMVEGQIVHFITKDNQTVSRTVLKVLKHPAYTSPYTGYDIQVGVLDSDLPPTIDVCKVMPSNWNDYLVEFEKGKPLALGLDQEEKARVGEFDYVLRLPDFPEVWEYTAGFTKPPIGSIALDFWENAISGDSGNPVFLILDLGEGDELVALFLHTTSTAGTFFPTFIADMNQMIVNVDADAGVSTGYTLTEADLSNFTSFA